MGTATAADDVQLAPPPGGELFHLGRRPEPFWWHLPEPLDLTADPIQTAAGRFDDPDGKYATLYCATDYYGALLETLAPLRPVPGLSEQIDQALEEPPDPEHDLPVGSKAFPSDFLGTQVMGIVRVDSAVRFVDVDHPRTHAALEQHGGTPLLKTLHVGRIDRGTFMSPDRRLTRQAAHALHELLGGSAIGLRYPSALDRPPGSNGTGTYAKPLGRARVAAGVVRPQARGHHHDSPRTLRTL